MQCWQGDPVENACISPTITAKVDRNYSVIFTLHIVDDIVLDLDK
jgi:hypothetical protein